MKTAARLLLLSIFLAAFSAQAKSPPLLVSSSAAKANVLIMLDTSGSMGGTNINIATKGIKALVQDPELRQDVQFGLGVWASYAPGSILIPISSNGASEIASSIGGAWPCYGFRGVVRGRYIYQRTGCGTNVRACMQSADSYLRAKILPQAANQSCLKTIVIVVSDGYWYGHSQALATARKLDKDGVQTFVLGLRLPGLPAQPNCTTPIRHYGLRNYCELAEAGGTKDDSPVFANDTAGLVKELKRLIRRVLSSNFTGSTPILQPGIETSDRILQTSYKAVKDKQWKGYLKSYSMKADGSVDKEQFEAGSKLDGGQTPQATRNIWTMCNGLPASKNNFTVKNEGVLKHCFLGNVVAPNPPVVPTTHTFNYTGAVQTWTVPTGVTSITVKAWGAQGGGAPATGYWGVGGKGGYSSGSASVKSGEAIYIEVGQQGFQSGKSGWPAIAYNGGGDGTRNHPSITSLNYTGFTGGGATHIAKVPGVLSNLAGQVSNILLVAGGGGGAGGTDRTWWSNRYIANGGHGGGWTGWGGATAANAWSYRRGGDGGTQTTRGWSPDASVAARFGRGATGRAQTSDWIQGGGGGGGYFGGGAGQQAGGGGGGGSGYIGGVTGGQTTAGNNTGNGSAQISYTACETRYRDVYKKKWQCEMRDQKVCHSVGTYSQPITTKPEVVRGGGKKWGQEKTNPNVMVYFGTGQYLADGDNANKDTQSFYGVWDRGDGSLGRNSLLEQTVSASGASGRVISTDAVNWKGTGTGQHYGCYFDLPDKGERVVTDPRYRQIDGLVYFNTLIPTDPRPCAVGGTGWLMAVAAMACGSPKSAAFDYDGDDLVGSKGDYAKLPKGKSGKEQSVGFAGKKYTAAKGTPAGVNIAGDRRFTPGSGTGEAADISSQRVQSGTGFMTKRLSWEQLFP